MFPLRIGIDHMHIFEKNNFTNSLLEEESQKREELERLRQEQEALLQQERQEREGLEGQREEQERLLAEAQSRLEQLEVERQAANAELQVGMAGYKTLRV